MRCRDYESKPQEIVDRETGMTAFLVTVTAQGFNLYDEEGNLFMSGITGDELESTLSESCPRWAIAQM